MASSIGKCFQIYGAEKMNLLFVGEMLEHNIDALVTFKELVFASVQGTILVYERAKRVYEMQSGSQEEIHSLLLLGSLLFGVQGANLVIFDLESQQLVNSISPGDAFGLSVIMHPSTYVNKILIGGSNAAMQLWNFKNMKMLYQFKNYHSPITCLSQSPSIDVVAIGLLDGTIILHNIKADREIMRFQQEQKVTAITFRTDGLHVMASASMSGDVALWDLEERRLIHLLRAHESSVHTCLFFSGMNVLLTAGADNAIKQWIFDALDGVPRLLKFRSGHYKPPTTVKHYGADGQMILSAGQDKALRLFSVIRDAQNTELSQGSIEKKSKKYGSQVEDLKLKHIVQFDCNPAKQRDWDNIITCHTNESAVKTWSFQRKAIGKHTLTPQDGSPVKSVCLSSCGNFCFIGTQQGRIDKFNMQSGIYRQSYVHHTKPVTSLVCDNVNKLLISSSLDATILFWTFNQTKLLHTLQMPEPVSHLTLGQESRLLAAVCDDMIIRVIDIDTHKIVRLFAGHTNRITSITFSPDERWIITCALDGTVRTWDLPSGHMIDAFRLPDLVTSISMSPTGDFLATTHVNHVGIFLWANRSQYENVPIRKLDVDEIRTPLMPAVGQVEQQEEEDIQVQETEQQWMAIQDDMINFSMLPKSRWQNLLSLEAIKKRNKPVEPPKEPEKAPFFLQTTAEAVPKFVMHEEERETKKTRVFDPKAITELSNALVEGSETGVYKQFFEMLKNMSPSAIDAELRLLEPHLFSSFMQAIIYQLDTKHDYELTLAYLLAFCKVSELMVDPCGHSYQEPIGRDANAAGENETFVGDSGEGSDVRTLSR
ncbi:quinon protein alcohol dehydrogenase-like superfamily [Gorgonomyces haynaldii]|nr:quinon protein alcohol dehydrogenase-like superfamily [Gorgonomyces haynaldii]